MFKSSFNWLFKVKNENFSGLQAPDSYAFFVPHALVVAEDRKLVCVADRQNGRVLCYDVNNCTFGFLIAYPQIGAYIYSVTYSPVNGEWDNLTYRFVMLFF